MTCSILAECWDYKISITSNNMAVISTISKINNISGIPVRYTSDNSRVIKGARLHVEDSAVTSLSFDKNQKLLSLYVDWSSINDQISTLTNLLGQLLSLVCWNDKVYPIHSSAVKYLNKTLLFLGGANCGKTTLSLTLCLEKEADYIANDWSAISISGNQVNVVKGYDLIGCSRMGAAQIVSVSDKCKLAGNDIFLIRSSELDIELRLKPNLIESKDLNFKNCLLPVKVDYVFFINIVPVQYTIFNEISRLEATGKLLNELIWPLRGTGSFVISNDCRASHSSAVLTPESGWEPICDLVNILTESAKCYQLHSSLASAINIIDSQIGN